MTSRGVELELCAEGRRGSNVSEIGRSGPP
jgi:hypothetical protein